jgi:hypothetical protein
MRSGQRALEVRLHASLLAVLVALVDWPIRGFLQTTPNIVEAKKNSD